MQSPTSASFSATIRCEIQNSPGSLANLLTVMGEEGAQMGAIDLVKATRGVTVRDISFEATGEEHLMRVIGRIKKLKDVKLRSWSDRVFLQHLGGKIEIHNKMPVNTRDALSIAYTPGVARVCMAIHEKPEKVYNLTVKRNSVAIVTDGTAVLGLGDIGPEAALPVMEGKAMLFKEFANIDAWPICLASKDTEEIVRTCQLIAPGFGGINLEDISAPRCFEIEQRLRETVDIPVFHDDQHGTAIVVLAALINALKIVGKHPKDARVVVIGAGAAGIACTKMMLDYGVKDIIVLDSVGVIYKGRRENMNPQKNWLANHSNVSMIKGDISVAASGADVFLGLSGPDLFPLSALKKMARDPIVFALSNPIPEIAPAEAAPYARIIATGRSDFPNQINNVLAFPGVFRGALTARASEINEEMKMAAASAVAGIITSDELYEENIVPSVFDKRVVRAVTGAVVQAAIKTRVARKHRMSQS